ncbi:MAG TPA: hypothetical protein VFC31_01865 [Candidatus Limnocylindria bacterium]|nr:hypothetical protein [Candidatus Limnocylindria bacterium]
MSLLYQNLALDELGRPIYMGIFSNIQGPLPAALLFVVSNQYTNGFGAHRQYTVISDPEGVTLAQSEESVFTLHNVMGAHRVDERFGIQLTKPGRHAIRVYLDGELAIEHYFMVVERRAAPEPAGG